MIYILSAAATHTISRIEDEGRGISMLSRRLSPYFESHADEVARALFNALLSRGCISDIVNNERPVLIEWHGNDAAGISIHLANGWPLDVTILERVKGFALVFISKD